MQYEGYKFHVNHEAGNDYLTLLDHRNGKYYNDRWNGHYDLEDLNIILDKLLLKANRYYETSIINAERIGY